MGMDPRQPRLEETVKYRVEEARKQFESLAGAGVNPDLIILHCVHW